MTNCSHSCTRNDEEIVETAAAQAHLRGFPSTLVSIPVIHRLGAFSQD